MNGSTFTSNSADDGGGIFNESGGTLTVSGSTFTSNSAEGGGGGIANEWRDADGERQHLHQQLRRRRRRRPLQLRDGEGERQHLHQQRRQRRRRALQRPIAGR